MFDLAGLVAIKNTGDQKSGDLNRLFAQYVKHTANASSTAWHMICLRKNGRPCVGCRTPAKRRDAAISKRALCENPTKKGKKGPHCHSSRS